MRSNYKHRIITSSTLLSAPDKSCAGRQQRQLTKNCSEIMHNNKITFSLSNLIILQGDSGGPLNCLEGNSWVVRGVVSWGLQRCPTVFYTVFARVSSYVEWINQNISGNSIAL